MDVSGRHVAFFGFPGFGHLRPTLPVVRELLARGHEVSYVVAERFAGVVAETGATVLTYPSAFPKSMPDVHTADDLATVLAHYLDEAYAPLATAWPAFADRPVDLVVEDVLSTDVGGLVARRAGCGVVRLFAGFGGNDEVPLNGSEVELAGPPLDPAHPALAACGERITALLAEFGLDTPPAFPPGGGEVVANLVFVPRAFQPRAECFGDEFVFVGPTGDDGAVAESWGPPGGDVPVVLVSLGTSSNSNPEFFTACGQAFAGTGWRVVMTTAGHVGDDVAAAMPDNVELHSWLDHRAVLPHTDVVVCQAGTGSLMDAFGHGVPVVAVPQRPEARVTAAQVERLGLGRALLDDVTGEDVRDAVLAVAADAAMAKEVARMREAIQASGGAKRAADVLERAVRATDGKKA
ncbi:macrolide family glycosyltransferase [Amycolatopsis kentuckyensis]|uniref:macrolide family glycosyltransferase n=1 Tax=Amycolatopsis kentuckyensis TaxID=218823 RepID=UPI0035686DD8